MKWNDYWLAPSQFLQRGEDLVIKTEETKDPACLFYSVLETRYCVERLLSQYLFMISNGKLSSRDETEWKVRNLKNAILKFYPDFIERLTFYSLWHKAKHFSEPFAVPDLDSLCQMHGHLSAHLHLPQKGYQPFYPATEFDSVLTLLKDSQKALRKYCYDELPPMKMNDRLETIFERMKVAQLSEAAVIELINSPWKSSNSWTGGFCDAGGARIHYQRTGGAKPPLVLLHGLTGNGACWTPLARSLQGEFDVVMPDARGHGQSSAPLHGQGYRYEELATDVVDLIRELGLSAPFVLGHSMGGLTAAVVASRLGVSISGVVLADPTFLSLERQRDVSVSDVAQQHRRLLGLTTDQVLAETRTRLAHRSPEIVELQVEARMQTRLDAFDVLIPPNPEYRQLVSAICVPTLLVIGDVGAVVSLEMARELQGLNPRVQIEQIEKAGHGVQYDQPERFATTVRSFLQSVITTGR